MSIVDVEGAARRLRELRGDRTQQEFANLLMIDRKTVVRSEKGDRPPSAELLVALNTVLGIEPSYVLTGEKPRASRPPGWLAHMPDPQLPSSKVEAAVKAVREAEIERLAFLEPSLLWIAVQHVATFGEATKGGYLAKARSKLDELLGTQRRMTRGRRKR